MTDEVDLQLEQEDRQWTCFKQRVPSSQIVFASQIIIIFGIVIVAIINLSLGSEPHDLWLSILSSCLGLLLPTPSVK